jgi:hypothetical protein
VHPHYHAAGYKLAGSTPELAASDAALTWLVTERTNLQAATNYAALPTRTNQAIYLPATTHQFLRMQGIWSWAAFGLSRTHVDCL